MGISAAEIIGLLNIVFGVMFVVACTMFIGGLVSFFVDFGNQERAKGITLMEWGVATLFVLVVLVGGVQYLQRNQSATNVITASIVVIGLAWVAFTVATEKVAPAKPDVGGAKPGSGAGPQSAK